MSVLMSVGGLTQRASGVGEWLGDDEGLGVRASVVGAARVGLVTALDTVLVAPAPQAAVAAAISVINTIRI
jgi:hypothetical protein